MNPLNDPLTSIVIVVLGGVGLSLLGVAVVLAFKRY
jgi:hypothetical protein